MVLIDTHAHLYDKQFENDLPQVIQRGLNLGVQHVLLPNIDLDSIDGLHRLCANWPQIFTPMMGLHPCSVDQNYQAVLDQLLTYFDKKTYCAVGEIGLDYYWDTKYKEAQQDAFRQQLNWAKDKQLPVAVHCRDAFDDILDILEDEQDGRLTGVLHCFTGNLEQAQRLINIGFYLGIGGVVTFKNGGLDKTLQHIDLKHCILETDSPYLAPVPNRGKRNESPYVHLIAKKVAEVKNISLEQVAEITTANARQLFQLV